MNSRAWMIRILAVLLAVGIGLSLADAYRTCDWWGALLNLGPELIGAVVTYLLFDQFIERRERIETEKARLLASLRSGSHDAALEAVAVLRERGWLEGDALKDANLIGANLEGLDLRNANLQGAILLETILEGADLTACDLRGALLCDAELDGAVLRDANLEGANLWDTSYGDHAVLPDGTEWMPDTHMARFTDREHPDFWRSDNPHSPAYRGNEE